MITSNEQKKTLKKSNVIVVALVVTIIILILWIMRNNEAQLNNAWLSTAGQRYYDAQKEYYDRLNKNGSFFNPLFDYEVRKIAPDYKVIRSSPVTDVASAQKVMANCLQELGREHCESIILGKIWIGEPKNG